MLYCNRCKLNCGITLLWSYLGFALIASIEDCSTLSCPFLAVISASRKDWRFFLAVISALRICCCSYICSSCFNDNFKISSLKFARSAWMALLLFSKQSYYKTRKRVIFTYVFCWFVTVFFCVREILKLFLNQVMLKSCRKLCSNIHEYTHHWFNQHHVDQ